VTLPFLVWTTAARYPARPASEVEWEELLVRLEIGPRAFRMAADGAAGQENRVFEVAHASVMHEATLTAVLEAMRSGGEVPESIAQVWDVDEEDDRHPLDVTVERWAMLRARNFAAVQRRGLGVWEWRTRGGLVGDQTVTAHQALLATLAVDAQALAAVRGEAGR
jgi:hypothetical protein